MDKLNQYRSEVTRLIRDYARLYDLKPTPGVETAVILDPNDDHYLLMTLGWDGEERVHHVVLHVRLREGRIWVEEDWTEEGIATELVRAGVPREEIVLAFQPPEMRHLTEFATA